MTKLVQLQRFAEVTEVRAKENSEKIQNLIIALNEQLHEQETHNKAFENEVIGLRRDISTELNDLRIVNAQSSTIIRKNISLLEEKTDKQISSTKKIVEKTFSIYDERLESVSLDVENFMSQLENELDIRQTETNNRMEELSRRLTALDVVVNKMTWKIAISIATFGSILFDVLHILGVL